MTTHQPIKNSDRTSLPRALLGRRWAELSIHPHEMKFAIGDFGTLNATDELAVVTGRAQVAGCDDEYVVELVEADAAPLDVLEWQIERCELDAPYCWAPMKPPRQDRGAATLQDGSSRLARLSPPAI